MCFASIEVDPKYQGQGFFTALVEGLRAAEDLPFDRLELESLLSARFGVGLMRRGFQRFGAVEGWGDLGASFYLELRRPDSSKS